MAQRGLGGPTRKSEDATRIERETQNERRGTALGSDLNAEQHVEQIRRLIVRIASTEQIRVNARRLGSDLAHRVRVGERHLLSMLGLQRHSEGVLAVDDHVAAASSLGTERQRNTRATVYTQLIASWLLLSSLGARNSPHCPRR